MSKLNNTIIILAVSSLFILTNTELVFDRIKPVLWLATNSKVSGGLLEYDINFAFTDPCSIYARHIQNHPPQHRYLDDEDKRIMQSFEDSCKALYHLEWLKEMEQLLDVELPDHHIDQPPERTYTEDLTRNKREVIYFKDLMKNDNDSLPVAHKRQRLVVQLALENHAKHTNQTELLSQNNSTRMTVERMTQLIEALENYAINNEGTLAERYLHLIMKPYILEDETLLEEPETSEGKQFIEYLESVNGWEFASLMWDVVRNGKETLKNNTANVVAYETKKIIRRLDELRGSKDPRSMVRTFQEFLEAKIMNLGEALIIAETIWPTAPLKLVTLENKHIRRELTTNDYMKEGTEPAQQRVAWWEPLLELVIGPIWTLSRPYSPRSKQLNRTLSRLMTLHEKITHAEITEKFLYGFSRTPFRIQEYELNNGIDPKVYTSYYWYEYLGIWIPTLGSYIYEVARERTLLEFIDKWKDNITKFLNQDHLQVYLENIVTDPSFNKFNYIEKVNDTNLIRPKRQILTGILLAGAGAAGKEIFSYFMANVATNLIQSVFDWINPKSNTNRLDRTEVMIKDFNENFKANQIVDRGILENLDKLSNIVQITTQRLEHQTRRFPEYSWLSGLIINRISLAGLDLQRVTDEARKGRIATAPLGRLLNLPELRKIDAIDTKLLSVSKINNNTVNFRFRAARTSPDTKVFKVYPFDHWDNLDDIPRLMKYKGKPYLIYNTTSNCIKSIDAAPDSYVGEQCTKMNGDDPALAQWEVIRETEDLTPYQSQSQVVKTLNGNYIYCFPGHITVQGHNYTCPMDPFRLDVTREFQTADQLHVPNFVTLNASKEYISATEVMHAGFFRDDSDTVQPLALFEALRHERKILREQNYTLDHSFVVGKSNPWFWTFISCNAGVTIGLIAFLMIRICCTQVQQQYRETIPMAPMADAGLDDSFRRPYNPLTQPLTQLVQMAQAQSSMSPPPTYNPVLKR